MRFPPTCVSVYALLNSGYVHSCLAFYGRGKLGHMPTLFLNITPGSRLVE